MTVIFFLAIFGIAIAVALVQGGRWRRTLADLAGRRGLQLTDGGVMKKASVQGTIEKMPITIDTYTESAGESQTTFSRISIAPGMPEGLMLRREGAFLGKLFKGEDLVIGDAVFDGDVIVRGPVRAVRALLDAPTRAAVLSGISRGITTGEGAIKWVKSGLADAATLDAAIDEVLELARLLSRPADAAALANVVRTDTPAIALEALRLMPAGPQRDAVDADVVASRADALVMTAAGRMGAAAAVGVTRVLGNQRNADALRADAMAWLGDHTDATELALACLTRQELSADTLTRAAALTVLTQAKRVVPLEALERLIEEDDAIAPEALRAARQHGVRAEPLLMAALANEQPAVACAAADGLGLVGTPAAVMPLQARVKGLFVNGELKAAAGAAVSLIQGRVGEMGGGLSVVSANASGRLSEARQSLSDPDQNG